MAAWVGGQVAGAVRLGCAQPPSSRCLTAQDVACVRSSADCAVLPPVVQPGSRVRRSNGVDPAAHCVGCGDAERALHVAGRQGTCRGPCLCSVVAVLLYCANNVPGLGHALWLPVLRDGPVLAHAAACVCGGGHAADVGTGYQPLCAHMPTSSRAWAGGYDLPFDAGLCVRSCCCCCCLTRGPLQGYLRRLLWCRPPAAGHGLPLPLPLALAITLPTLRAWVW